MTVKLYANVPTTATAIGGLAPQAPDPIFAALAETKQLLADWTRQFNELYEAEAAATDVHGERPSFDWAGAEWDDHAGLTSMRAQYQRTVAAGQASRMQFAMTKPTTLQGVLALLEYIVPSIEEGETGEDWERAGLRTAAEALRGLDGEVQQISAYWDVEGV